MEGGVETSWPHSVKILAKGRTWWYLVTDKAHSSCLEREKKRFLAVEPATMPRSEMVTSIPKGYLQCTSDVTDLQGTTTPQGT